MREKDTLLGQLDELAAIPRWRSAGKVLLAVAIAAAATATRTPLTSVAVAVALAALAVSVVCFLRARQLSARLTSPGKSQLGGLAASFEAAKGQPPGPDPSAVEAVGPVLEEPVAVTADSAIWRARSYVDPDCLTGRHFGPIAAEAPVLAQIQTLAESQRSQKQLPSEDILPSAHPSWFPAQGGTFGSPARVRATC